MESESTIRYDLSALFEPDYASKRRRFFSPSFSRLHDVLLSVYAGSNTRSYDSISNARLPPEAFIYRRSGGLRRAPAPVPGDRRKEPRISHDLRSLAERVATIVERYRVPGSVDPTARVCSTRIRTKEV